MFYCVILTFYGNDSRCLNTHLNNKIYHIFIAKIFWDYCRHNWSVSQPTLFSTHYELVASKMCIKLLGLLLNLDKILFYPKFCFPKRINSPMGTNSDVTWFYIAADVIFGFSTSILYDVIVPLLVQQVCVPPWIILNQEEIVLNVYHFQIYLIVFGIIPENHSKHMIPHLALSFLPPSLDLCGVSFSFLGMASWYEGWIIE